MLWLALTVPHVLGYATVHKVRLRFDNDAYTNLHHVRGNNKINGNKIED